MKHVISIAISLMIMQQSLATIYHVNPTPGEGDFTDIQQAHDSPIVNPGDVLILDGIPGGNDGDQIVYPGLVWTKQLTITGPGYFLQENGVYATPFQEVLIVNVTMNPGCEGSSMGSVRITQLNINASNTIVEKCKIESVNLNAFSGQLKQNYIQNSVPGPAILLMNTGNYQIQNNFIGNFSLLDNTNFSVNKLTPGSGFAIQWNYNTFVGGKVYTTNSNLYKNIFSNVNMASTSGNFYSCNAFDTQLILPSTDPNGEPNDPALIFFNGNNVTGIPPGSLFIGGFSPDGQWQLQSDSPASTTCGSDQAGMFGSFDAYQLSGLSPQTTLSDLSILQCIPEGINQMPVTFSAFSNTSDTIDQAFYSIDGSPAIGVPVSSTGVLNEYFFTAMIGGFGIGDHTFTMFVVASDGVTSASLTVQFKIFGDNTTDAVPPSVDAYELFATDDLGMGANTVVPATPFDDGSLVFTFIFPAPGVYDLGFRVRDSDGRYGTTQFKTVYIYPDQEPLPDLERIEYYFDNDPGYDNGGAQFLSGTQFNGTIDIPLNSLSFGWHQMFVRPKDTFGSYGTVAWKWIYVGSETLLLADIDNNCIVNVADLLLLMGNYGCTSNCFANMNPGDDDVVNTSDLLLFMSAYGLPGEAPPGSGGGTDDCSGSSGVDGM